MMDKRRKIPRKDLEKLSAYIDGQLDDRQTQRLETRLQQEPELYQELEALRTTVQGLRALPVSRPTRHFTLTPEMVGLRQARSAFPVLRFATALAGLVFVALVGLEGLQSLSAAPMAARAPEIMQEAQVAEDAFGANEEPVPAAPAEDPAAELEAMEMPAEEGVEEESEPLMLEAPEAEESIGVGEDQAQKITGTPDPTEAAAMADAEETEGRSGFGTETEEGDQLSAEESLPVEVPQEALTEGDTQTQQGEAFTQLSTLRWLQVLTGALFIILSVLSITFRKRST